MNRTGILAGVLTVLAVVQAAPAQYVQPQVSPYGGSQSALPYLNMLRGGNPAVNYMGLVQPQLQAQSNFQLLQNQAAGRMAAPGVAPPRNSGVADTGYAPARFMQYQQYFMTLSGGQRLNNPNVNNQAIPGMGIPAARFGGR